VGETIGKRIRGREGREVGQRRWRCRRAEGGAGVRGRDRGPGGGRLKWEGAVRVEKGNVGWGGEGGEVKWREKKETGSGKRGAE